MKKLILSALLSATTLLASHIEVHNAYVRATPPGLPNSAAFMTIKNTSSEDISIMSASSKVSKVVELHTHDMKNGVMKMYQVPKIDVAKHSKTVLKPGGYHIMLIGLYHPLKVGETVTLTLKLSNGERKTITAPIKTVMGGMKHHSMDHSKMNHDMKHTH